MKLTYPEVHQPDWAKYDMPVTFKVLKHVLKKGDSGAAFRRRAAYRMAIAKLEQHHAKTGQQLYSLSDGLNWLIEAAREVSWWAADTHQAK